MGKALLQTQLNYVVDRGLKLLKKLSMLMADGIGRSIPTHNIRFLAIDMVEGGAGYFVTSFDGTHKQYYLFAR